MTLRNRRRLLATALAAAVVVVTTTVPAGAARMCGGKRATHVGTRGSDFLFGSNGPDVFVTLTGPDQVYGRGGNDTICAGKGGDFVLAGPGNDTILGQQGSDDLSGDAGNDRIEMGGGETNTASGGPGDDVLSGGAGLDFAGFLEAPGGVTVDLHAGFATGEGSDTIDRSIEGAFGSRFADTLRGGFGNNVLVGGGGPDFLDSGGNGGGIGTPRTPGVDLLAGDGDPGELPADDVIQGGPGLNVAAFTTSPAPLEIDLGRGTAVGEGSDSLDAVQGAIGGDYDDTMTGDEGDNVFRAGSGDDTIDGEAGVDVASFTGARGGISADLGAGTATGEGEDSLTGIEHLWGSRLDDDLTGDAVDNSLFGLRGFDSLSGEGGDDTLNGGKGRDSLDGGEGSDRCTAGEDEVSCEATFGRSAPTARALLRSSPEAWMARLRRLTRSA